MVFAVIGVRVVLRVNGHPKSIQRIGLAIAFIYIGYIGASRANRSTLATLSVFAILVEPSNKDIALTLGNSARNRESVVARIALLLYVETLLIRLRFHRGRNSANPRGTIERQVIADLALLLLELGGKRTAFVFVVASLGDQFGAIIAQLDVVVVGIILGDLNVLAAIIYVPAVKLVAGICRGGGAVSSTLFLSDNAFARGINGSALARFIRVIDTLKLIAQLNGVVIRHRDAGNRSILIQRVFVIAMSEYGFILEHGKRLARDAPNSIAHVFVFNELSVFFLEEVFQVDRTGRAIFDFIGIQGIERQVAIALAVALTHVLEDVVIGEVKGITGGIAGAILVALNFPSEENLILGGNRHTIGNDGGGVINNVVGGGVRNLTRSLTQIILHAIGGLLAGQVEKLKGYAAVSGVGAERNRVRAILVHGYGCERNPVPSASISNLRGLAHARRELDVRRTDLLAPLIQKAHFAGEILISVFQINAERGGTAQCERLVEPAFAPALIAATCEGDSLRAHRHDLGMTSVIQVGFVDAEIFLCTGDGQLVRVSRIASGLSPKRILLDIDNGERGDALTRLIRIQDSGAAASLGALRGKVQIDPIDSKRVYLPCIVIACLEGEPERCAVLPNLFGLDCARRTVDEIKAPTAVELLIISVGEHARIERHGFGLCELDVHNAFFVDRNRIGVHAARFGGGVDR